MYTATADTELGDKTPQPSLRHSPFSSSLHGGSPVISARSDLRVKMRGKEQKELGALNAWPF